jgi:hypothetical protein
MPVLPRLSKYYQIAQSRLIVREKYGSRLTLDRWGQTYILEAMMNYVPQDTQEAVLLAERISPRLSHSNSAVVLTCVRVIIYLLNYIADEKVVNSLCTKLSPPLVTLLSKGPEIQYLALRNALLILQRRPDVLRNDIRVFFCKYNDPIYVKVTKLELIFMLATERNIHEVLTELREYVHQCPCKPKLLIVAGTPPRLMFISSANPYVPLANLQSRSSRLQNCVSIPCSNSLPPKSRTLSRRLPSSFAISSASIPTDTSRSSQRYAKISILWMSRKRKPQ